MHRHGTVTGTVTAYRAEHKRGAQLGRAPRKRICAAALGVRTLDRGCVRPDDLQPERAWRHRHRQPAAATPTVVWKRNESARARPTADGLECPAKIGAVRSGAYRREPECLIDPGGRPPAVDLVGVARAAVCMRVFFFGGGGGGGGGEGIQERRAWICRYAHGGGGCGGCGVGGCVIVFVISIADCCGGWWRWWRWVVV